MKMSNLFFLGLVMFLENSYRCYCWRMKIIPGIPSIKGYDSNYMEDIVLETRRYGRKSDYVVNMEVTNKYYASNNISFHFIFKEYLHNEYRRSFIEVHIGLCDLILNDTFIGPIVRSAGMTVCPIPPGRIRLMNMTFNQEFPSFWPFEKGQGEVIGKAEPSGKEIVRGDLTMTFKMYKN